jgi:hypothetical protein
LIACRMQLIVSPNGSLRRRDIPSKLFKLLQQALPKLLSALKSQGSLSTPTGLNLSIYVQSGDAKIKSQPKGPPGWEHQAPAQQRTRCETGPRCGMRHSMRQSTKLMDATNPDTCQVHAHVQPIQTAAATLHRPINFASPHCRRSNGATTCRRPDFSCFTAAWLRWATHVV